MFQKLDVYITNNLMLRKPPIIIHVHVIYKNKMSNEDIVMMS